MPKRIILSGYLIFILSLVCSSQERIISFGYTKNFVNKDSSNFAIAIDLNRAPGKSESASSRYFVSTPLGNSPILFYLKPSADINIGSYTTNAPNNIAGGLPFGFARLINTRGPGEFFITLEGSPEIVADKSLETYLMYFSSGLVLNYSYTSPSDNNVLDLAFGFKTSYGKRLQNIKTKVKNPYSKIMIPVTSALSLFRNAANDYYRIKFSGIFKFNHINKDDEIITPKRDRLYVQLKADYFIMKQLGLNMTYSSGYEEPLFKKVSSLAFGITLAY